MSDPRSGNESGMVLILLMLVVVLVGTASLGIASTSRDTFAATRGEAAQAEAQAALDGALATARHRLREDPEWRGSIEQIGLHRIEITVDPIGSGYRLGLIARAGDARDHTVAATVTVGAPEGSGSLPPVRDYRLGAHVR